VGALQADKPRVQIGPLGPERRDQALAVSRLLCVAGVWQCSGDRKQKKENGSDCYRVTTTFQ